MSLVADNKGVWDKKFPKTEGTLIKIISLGKVADHENHIKSFISQLFYAWGKVRRMRELSVLVHRFGFHIIHGEASHPWRRMYLLYYMLYTFCHTVLLCVCIHITILIFRIFYNLLIYLFIVSYCVNVTSTKTVIY